MWPRIASTALGLWLMVAPAVLGYGNPAANNDRIVGPLVAGFAIVAIWEATRGVRWLNLPLGIWLLVAPWLLGYPTIATVNSMVVGALLIVLSRLGGEVTQRFGGGWSALFSEEKTREHQLTHE